MLKTENQKTGLNIQCNFASQVNVFWCLDDKCLDICTGKDKIHVGKQFLQCMRATHHYGLIYFRVGLDWIIIFSVVSLWSVSEGFGEWVSDSDGGLGVKHVSSWGISIRHNLCIPQTQMCSWRGQMCTCASLSDSSRCSRVSCDPTIPSGRMQLCRERLRCGLEWSSSVCLEFDLVCLWCSAAPEAHLSELTRPHF